MASCEEGPESATEFEGGVRRRRARPDRTRPMRVSPNSERTEAPLRAPAPRSGGAATQLRFATGRGSVSEYGQVRMNAAATSRPEDGRKNAAYCGSGALYPPSDSTAMSSRFDRISTLRQPPSYLRFVDV